MLILISVIDIGIFFHQWVEDPGIVYPVYIITPIIRIITFAATIFLVIYHRKGGARSSGVLFTFWIIMLVCGFPQLRSVLRSIQMRSDGHFGIKHLIWTHYTSCSYIVYYAVVFTTFVLNCVADQFPLKEAEGKNQSPELTASFLRKIFFQWYDGFMWQGLRTTIDADDVWDLKSESLTSRLNAKFDKYWNNNDCGNEKVNSDVTRLLLALYQTVGHQIWTTGLLKLINNLLLLAAPQVLG